MKTSDAFEIKQGNPKNTTPYHKTTLFVNTYWISEPTGVGKVITNLIANTTSDFSSYVYFSPLSPPNKRINNILVRIYRYCMQIFIGTTILSILFIYKNPSIRKSICFFTENISFTYFIISLFVKNNVYIVHDLYYLSDSHKRNVNYNFSSLNIRHWPNHFKTYLYYRFGNVRQLRKARLLFAISQKTKNDLIKHGVEPQKIVVTYLGTALTYKTTKNLMDKKYILCVGTEMPRKNMHHIILAFKLIKKQFPDLVLLKVGQPYDYKTGRNVTLKSIAASGLDQHNDIKFIEDCVSEEDLQAYYHHAEMLLFPSLEEGFGLPIIEAQSCGCPVITSNRMPMSEICPYHELLADPEDPKDIANKALLLLNDEDYRQKKIKQGLEFSKQFTWKRFAQTIESELDKLG